MIKAIFLDRDGTINIDKGYVYKIEDFEFIPKTIDSLKILQNKGYILIIVTSQSGIGRGYYKEEDFGNRIDIIIAIGRVSDKAKAKNILELFVNVEDHSLTQSILETTLSKIEKK